MKQIKHFILCIAALAAITLPPVSNAVFVDLSGIEVNGDPPTVIIVEEDEYLTDPFDIFYSFKIHHYWPSLADETEISLYNFTIENPADGTIEISGSSDCGFGSESGTFTCSGTATVLDPFIFPGDEWTITLSDSFDDWFVDYVFLDESYIAWGDDAPSPSVPEPSTLLLMTVGIIGFCAVRLRASKRITMI